MRASWRSSRSAVTGDAPETDRGIIAAAGTFISARTERTAVMNAINQLISAAASASSKPGSGQRVSISSGRGLVPFRSAFRHSSSVMNGMKGCSIATMRSSTQATVARVSSRAPASSPASTGLASSRYQSQVRFHTNR
jgi:hypothetical protein